MTGRPSVRRVSVVGSPGAGKSTVARALAAALDVPVLELDGLGDDLRTRVDEFTARGAWVVEGNDFEMATRDVVWPRADAIVWLDLPRSLIVRRLFSRALRRDGRAAIRDAWTMHAERRERFEEGLIGLDAELARLRSPAAVKKFLAALG